MAGYTDQSVVIAFNFFVTIWVVYCGLPDSLLWVGGGSDLPVAMCVREKRTPHLVLGLLQQALQSPGLDPRKDLPTCYGICWLPPVCAGFQG